MSSIYSVFHNFNTISTLYTHKFALAFFVDKCYNRAMMKKLILVLLIVLIPFTFTACGSDNPSAAKKVIEKNGLTVTLNENFKEQSGVSGDNLVLYYECKSSFFLATENDKSAEYDGLASYVDAVSGELEMTLDTQGLALFYYGYYTRKKGCNSFGYMLCVYEGANEYYVVNIGCKASKLDSLKGTFFEYARSVTVA